ncbi:HAD hydrolase-like protein [Candidatus Woesearchaeota archaeon]|nr:hypothetical protein [uncultured archaeon]MBS3167285.1 HAD hydrolase-like protein [Candidatus Woesearchaeota archaeon]
MRTILVFDNDGVLRDESKSYQKAISQTVFDFSDNYPSEEELIDSMKESNDDWQRTYNILNQRGINIKFDEVKEHFQDLYLGKKRDFTGYINDEPWLIENILLYKLSKRYEMVIVSGAPREEIEFTLKKNYARCFFNEIWGMHECNGKKDGLEKVIERFSPPQILFCDDRPSPLKEANTLSNVKAYGIIPPQKYKGWGKTLREAGAKKVFRKVNNYCKAILEGRIK